MEENLCRICMTCTDDVSPLFNYENDSYGGVNDVGKMFVECLQLELYPHSGYSDLICHYCKLQLNVFYNFILMAKRSHEKCTLLLETLTAITEPEEEVLIENVELPPPPSLSPNIKEEINNEDTDTTDTIQTSKSFEFENEEQWIEDNDIDYSIEYLDDDKEVTEACLQKLKQEELYLSENNTAEYYTDIDSNALLEKDQYNDNNVKIVEKEYIDEKPEYECLDCDEIFLTKRDFKSHRTSVHPVTKYDCEQCGKKFKIYEMYESHLRIHDGLSPFECNECHKTFNYKSNYQNHLKMHTGEKPFPCTLCIKSFRSKWDLIIHTRVHKDIRKYACNICNKRFRVSSHMTSHRYTHYEKQFECDICHQKYTSPRTLKQHKNTIHSDIFPYNCTWCDRKFKRKHHIDNHMKVHRKS